MNKKLKFLLLKILLLLFLILPLPIEAVFFLGTTIHLNFETTITGDSLNPKFHITSLIPTITDRSISLPNIKQVTISQIGPGDNYYKLKFELEGKLCSKGILSSISKFNVICEFIVIIIIYVNNFIYWSLIYITIIFIVLVLFIKLKRAERKTIE